MSAEDRAYWNLQASSFDDEPDHGLRDPATRLAWRDLLREHLPPAPADIIDLGCGTGTLSVLVAQEGHQVLGVDFAESMVSAAADKAAKAGVSATFLQGDASGDGSCGYGRASQRRPEDGSDRPARGEAGVHATLSPRAYA